MSRPSPRSSPRSRLVWLALPPVLLVLAVGATFPAEDQDASQVPRYVNGTQLKRPLDYRRWIFVGASLGLSYSASASPSAPSRRQMFHHTYIAPRAYEEFVRTGVFPEKTMLVLELYEPGEKADPATAGLFEEKRGAVEVAVKDREHFADGWAYFGFGDGTREAASAFPASAGCVTCHRQHAATDNVFTQFYPVLREVKGVGHALLDPPALFGSHPRCPQGVSN